MGKKAEIQNEEHLQDLEDYEAFARTIGALLYNTSHVDIIQLALKEPEESAVYKAALKITSERPQRLFFDWKNRKGARSPLSATILHHGVVWDAAFLQDITNILTTNGDGQVKVFDVASGEILYRFTGHKNKVNSISLSPGGDSFVSGSEDGAVKIWDLGNFQSDSHLPPGPMQHDILRKGSVKGRSHHLKVRTKQSVNSLLTSDHEIRDLSNQSFVFNDVHHENVQCVAFGPFGEEVAAGGQSGEIKIFNLKARNERLCLKGHKETVNTLDFGPDGRTLCSGSDDATIIIWNIRNGQFKSSNNMHLNRVTHVKYVPESKRRNKIVSLSADKLIMWESPALSSKKDGFNVVEFKRARHADFICMQVSSNGEYLAAGTSDTIITLWDLKTTQVVLSLPGHNDHIYVVDFTPDDRFLLSGSADETVMIWSLETLFDDLENENESEKISNKHQSFSSLGQTFDQKFLDDNVSILAASDDNQTIRVLHNGITKYQSPSDVSVITCIALCKTHCTGSTCKNPECEIRCQGLIAYGCQNGSVRLYFPVSKSTKTLGTHSSSVRDLVITMERITISPDETIGTAVVVSGSEDGAVKIWWDGGRALNCQIVHTDPVRQIKLLSNQRTISRSAFDGKILVMWKLRDGQVLDSFSFENKNSTCTSMDVGKNDMVAIGTSDGLIYLFHTPNEKFDLKHILKPNSTYGPVRILRFDHAGLNLATGHDTGVCEIWDVNHGIKLYAPLRLHQSWVTDIQFGKDNLHMVTVGDKIAWWALDHLPRKRQGTNMGLKMRKISTTNNSVGANRDPFKRRSKLDSNESAEQSPPGVSPLKKEFDECTKIGHKDSKELLQVFDIRGSAVTRIHASEDFKKFVTIDNAGIIYILEEINNSCKF